MNLGLYVSQLLPEHEMVIVPGFGAFVSVYQPARIDKESNQILPPSNEVSFNSKIRNNDNLLVGYVSEQEKIIPAEALKWIEKEREDILYRLDKGERVMIEGLGTVSLNESREIQFESFEHDNLLLESYGLGAVSLEDEPEDVVADEIILETEESAVIPSANQPEVKDAEPEFQPVEETEPWYVEDNREEKKKSWLWLLLILVPLVGAGIYIYFSKEKDSPTVVNSANVQQQQPVESLPESAEFIENLPDSAVSDSSGLAVTQIPEIQENNNTEIKFYLVGGSFKEEENAEKYLQQLKDAGYEPFHLGKRGNYYLIGIGTYSSEEDALAAQDSFFEKNNGSGAWVYEQ